MTRSEMMALIEELYPICRSITGDGVRETLAIVGETIDLEIHEVPSGTAVLDWTVPPEWNIRDAYIADSGGRRVVDFREHNLHVVGKRVWERVTVFDREAHRFVGKISHQERVKQLTIHSGVAPRDDRTTHLYTHLVERRVHLNSR